MVHQTWVGSLVKRLRRWPLTPETWVRFPYESPGFEYKELFFFESAFLFKSVLVFCFLAAYANYLALFSICELKFFILGSRKSQKMFLIFLISKTEKTLKFRYCWVIFNNKLYLSFFTLSICFHFYFCKSDLTFSFFNRLCKNI